jgi:hypothetical protein
MKREAQPMTDTYTRIILTVIAACLVAIVVRQASPVANGPIRARVRWQPSGIVPRSVNTVSLRRPRAAS